MMGYYRLSTSGHLSHEMSCSTKPCLNTWVVASITEILQKLDEKRCRINSQDNQNFDLILTSDSGESEVNIENEKNYVNETDKIIKCNSTDEIDKIVDDINCSKVRLVGFTI